MKIYLKAAYDTDLKCLDLQNSKRISKCVALRFGPAGQEVSGGDKDDSEDHAHGLGEKTGSHPGAHQVQHTTQVRHVMQQSIFALSKDRLLSQEKR